MTPVISLKGVGKKYRISPSRSQRLREILSFGKMNRSHDFWALKDMDLEVEPGTTLGILGRNGAGKSTLLRIISGVLQPTTGTVVVNGRLTAIFGLGSGFNPEFTGRENVMLNGLILGIDYREMLERFDDIAAFADVGEFMDQPVRTYSSGMRSRLGFAVAVNVEPDILVLDEALSAGDAAFKKKALQRMYDLRDSGTTVLFVSHSLGMVQRFCTEAVLLHKGHMVTSGDPSEVVARYRDLIEGKQEKNPQTGKRDRQLDEVIQHEDEEDFEETPTSRNGLTLGGESARILHHVTGDARILYVEVLDESQEQVDAVASGSSLAVRVHLQYMKAVRGTTLGITLRDDNGLDVFSTSTTEEKTPLRRRKEGEQVTVDFTFEVPLRPGTYNVDAAVFTPGGENLYLDRADEVATFRITRSQDGRSVRGLVHLPTAVEIHGPEGQREKPSNSV
jgi:ABC-type polysaccharide/polyol phosphate transport system ATPase subunit